MTPFKNIPGISEDVRDGMKNLQSIMKISDWRNKYPAFAWCAEHGDGWYLPAIEELKLLLLNDDVYDAVNAQIESMRKRKLFLKGRSRCSYWSSTAEDPSFCEYGGFRAWIVYMGSEDALCWPNFDYYYVRAVSAF